jgi:hypothetical protein
MVSAPGKEIFGQSCAYVNTHFLQRANIKDPFPQIQQKAASLKAGDG